MPAAGAQLRNLIKIRNVRKESIIKNLSDVLMWSFGLEQSAPACGLTHGCVTMILVSQSCELPTSLSFFS